MPSASHSVVHPRPIPVATIGSTWDERQHDPELACATFWSEACRAWWQHERDDRLRRRAFDTLFVDAAELAAWHAMRLDERGLIRAHAHVIAMRAGVEREHLRRTLEAGALRTTPVIAHTRGGGLFLFPHASEVRPAVAQLVADLDRLPAHPLVRAAWIAHTVGAIHPFGDGNGGTMRLLASLELTRASLPPFVLTETQRGTSYIDAVAGTSDLMPLLRVLHAAVQHELAALLLGVGDDATWSDATHARADRWVARVDHDWRAAVDLPLVADEAGPDSVARFARRGYHRPRSRAPRATRWRLASPLPVQLDLRIEPVVGGDRTWLIACVAASVGDAAELAPRLHREQISTIFVALDEEPDELVDARFARWLTTRISQSIRGLAAWM